MLFNLVYFFSIFPILNRTFFSIHLFSNYVLYSLQRDNDLVDLLLQERMRTKHVYIIPSWCNWLKCLAVAIIKINKLSSLIINNLLCFSFLIGFVRKIETANGRKSDASFFRRPSWLNCHRYWMGDCMRGNTKTIQYQDGNRWIECNSFFVNVGHGGSSQCGGKWH